MSDIGKPLSETQVWHLIFDAAMLQHGDDRMARDEADEYVKAHTEFHGWKRAEREKEVKRARKQRRAHRWAVVGWSALAVGITGGLSGGIYAITWSQLNNHAGYDQSQVDEAASDAVTRWYGQNDLPPNLNILARERSSLRGREAWKVTMRPAGKNENVCVYIWNEEGSPDPYEVLEGSAC